MGILGNSPPEAFPPVQLDFGEGGPAIYTYDDKTGKSGRSIGHIVPAPIGKELTLEAQDIAARAFKALGLYDCARVDLRLDGDLNPYILEINSLPSLGEHGSYVAAAEAMGIARSTAFDHWTYARAWLFASVCETQSGKNS